MGKTAHTQLASRQFPGRNSLQCKRAVSNAEIESASHFWHSRYRDAGLKPIDESTSHVAAVDGLGNVQHFDCERSVTFVASYLDWQVLDSPSKDSASPKVIEGMFRQKLCGTVSILLASNNGQTFGQVSRLAMDSSRATRNAVDLGQIFQELTRCVRDHAINLGLSQLHAIVHPRHARLYQRVFDAEFIGNEFRCEDVGGAPAVLIRVQIGDETATHRSVRTNYRRVLKTRAH